MRYTIELSGESHSVDVVAVGPGRYRVQIGDRAPETVEATGSGALMHVLSGGQSHAVELGPNTAFLKGHVAPCEVVDARTARLRAQQGGLGSGGTTVRSPMPGRIVKVMVAEGDPVRAGQGVIIVEAMKMENELRAEIDGVVEAVRCAAGDTVESNAELVVLRPAEA
jgi:biotin carboxyl carrier protein